MATLKLTLKKEWFDMVFSGEKKEEYREIKPYWITRFFDFQEKEYAHFMEMCEDMTNPTLNHSSFAELLIFFDAKIKQFDFIQFTNGYRKDSPKVIKKFGGLDIGIGDKNHGAPNYPVFKLLLH